MNTTRKILLGESVDFHKLIKCKKSFIILGDTQIESEYKIQAHSDGDLVMHAIANAILGACCKGDIGIYFPDTNNKYKNIDSKKILLFATTQIPKHFQINNIDLTIICDKIKLSQYRNKITQNLVNLTKCKKVNVKFTRFEEDKKLIGCSCIASIVNKK